MSDRGFSLIEVLVALSVFSIAAVSLVELTGNTNRSARRIDAHVIAGIEADNHLALLQAGEFEPEPGFKSGNSTQLGRELAWREQVTAAPVDGLLLAEVTIADPDTEEQLAQRHLLLEARP